MKKINNFKELALYILEIEKKPLTAIEIWRIAENLISNNAINFIKITGITPERTLGARIYTDIKDNPENTKFVKLLNPSRFTLKIFSTSEDTKIKDLEEKYSEKDMHLKFVTWNLLENKIHCKTIEHATSKKNNIVKQ